MIRSTSLGYPRIGPRRQLKKALEDHWAGEIDAAALLHAAAEVEQQALRTQAAAGIDIVPAGDFSLYDHVLDAACLVGAIPSRFLRGAAAPASPSAPATASGAAAPVDLSTYFGMARGIRGGEDPAGSGSASGPGSASGSGAPALEMTKWFDTNYHYLVPEFTAGQRFHPASDRPLQALEAARRAGIGAPVPPGKGAAGAAPAAGAGAPAREARIVLLGPVSLLLLGKPKSDGLVPLRDHLDGVVEVYVDVLRRLAAAGATWVQFDEPCLVADRADWELAALASAYGRLARAKGSARIAIATYFGDVAPAFPTLAALPVDALALDFVRGGAGNLEAITAAGAWPADKTLIAGAVNGRNVWISPLRERLARLEGLAARTGPDRLQVSPSCSLLHVPLDARSERALDPEVRPWLAFAQQKLQEVDALARALREGTGAVAAALAENDEALARRREAARLHGADVADRIAALSPADLSRPVPYARRRAVQAEELGLPSFPTTTIGSFPQTAEVRRLRSRWRRGELSEEGYDRALEEETRRTIAVQEEIGLDVLVHGEFERNDMVEYFGEQLDGFLFTENGWVQSYGSRCVKPPILFGTVRRPKPMTVRWSAFAQSCTGRPVKGMLTGPVTILQWSFVRDDQPRSRTCQEIALAIRDEVGDLERAGIGIVQVDEPALREGLPLRRAQWPDYLAWATAAFRLATSGAAEATQLHTHMCYGEFGDIIDAIASLDADVLSIENARSGAELLSVFREHGYGAGIGPGVYDIHSPRVPPAEEMAALLEAAAGVLPADQLWVNPDCGLKTRAWPETVAALRNMVEAAGRVREALGAAVR